MGQTRGGQTGRTSIALLQIASTSPFTQLQTHEALLNRGIRIIAAVTTSNIQALRMMIPPTQVTPKSASERRDDVLCVTFLRVLEPTVHANGASLL